MREHICLVALTSPADWKITAFSTWSLSKLAEHLVKQKVTAAIGRETLRRIPHAGKVSWKATTRWEAWLESPDSCREFTTSISGDGRDVVRCTGSRATARLTRNSRGGEVVIKRLNSQFQAVEQLFRSHRSVMDGELVMPAKPAWLAVHCQGTWSLTTSPDRPANGALSSDAACPLRAGGPTGGDSVG